MLPIDNLNMSLIGSNGRMGQMLIQKLKGKVQKLNLIDLRPESRELNEEDLKITIPESDLVLLAVPASNLENVLKKISRFLRFNTLLSDITSVKILPMQLMEKYHPGPVVGTHPLFGPGASLMSPTPNSDQDAKKTPSSSLDENETTKNLESTSEQPKSDATTHLPQCEFDDELRNVALVKGIHAQYTDLQLMESLFYSMGFKTFETTATEHDQAIAIIQALNFLSNLAYFSTASKLPKLEKYVTPSFKRRLTSAQKMLLDDAALFTGIARSIPELHMAVDEYIRALQNAASLDQGNIDKMLQMARKYYDQFPYS